MPPTGRRPRRSEQRLRGRVVADVVLAVRHREGRGRPLRPLAGGARHVGERRAPTLVFGEFGAPLAAQRRRQLLVEVGDLGVVGVVEPQAHEPVEHVAPRVEPIGVGLQVERVALDHLERLRAVAVRLERQRQVARARVAQARFGQVAFARQPPMAIEQRREVERERLAHGVARGHRPRHPVAAARAAAAVDQGERLVEDRLRVPPPLLEVAALEAGRSCAFGAQLERELRPAVAREVADRGAPGGHVGAGDVEFGGVGATQRHDRFLDARAPARQLAARRVEAGERRQVAVEFLELAAHARHVGPEGRPCARPHPRAPRGFGAGPHAPEETGERPSDQQRRRPAGDQLDAQGDDEHGRQVGERAGRTGQRTAGGRAPRAGGLRHDEHRERPYPRPRDHVAGEHARPGARAAAQQERPAEDEERPRQQPRAPPQRAAEGGAHLDPQVAGRERRHEHRGERDPEGEEHQADGLEVEGALRGGAAPPLAGGGAAPGSGRGGAVGSAFRHAAQCTRAFTDGTAPRWIRWRVTRAHERAPGGVAGLGWWWTAGLGAFAVGHLAGAPQPWLAAWLTLIVGFVAASGGARLGVAAIAGAALLTWWWPGDAPRSLWTDVGVAATALLAAAAGGLVQRAARSSAEAARAGGRRARLLVEAALDLGAAPDEDAVLSTLPPLVTRVLACEHAAVLRVRPEHLELVAIVPPVVGPGLVVPLASISGRAARTGIAQHVEDAARDPEYVGAPGLTRAGSEFALPLSDGRSTIAVLNVERDRTGAFAAEDRAALEALARIAGAHLGRLRTVADVVRERRESELLAHVARRLTVIEEPQRAAAAALELLVDALGLEGGVVFTIERGVFRPLAATVGLPDDVLQVLDGGLPWGRGRIHRVWRQSRPVYVADDAVENPEGPHRDLGLRALAIVPVTDPDGETVALIEVGARAAARAWTEDDRRLVEAVASTLGAALARATQRIREGELLEVVRVMAQSDATDELYRRGVEAAVRLVPGAEAASLLVRAEDGTYAFAAAEGYDLEQLRAAGPMTEAEQLVWYGDGVAGYRAGEPRLRVGGAVAAASAAASPGHAARTVLDGVGRSRQIRANVCIPIAFQGDVVGVLNVDAFTREDAFGRRSIAIAEALGQHVAVIVRQAHDRAALARSALVDPLTGIGNREAFNRQVTIELARAKRHDHRLALAMIDLDGFKEVNDRLGHAAGDRALALVARTLRDATRAADAVFRWGGDEFAVVMPMITSEEAQSATERFARAIGELDVEGMRLGASVGIAGYPEDGRDTETLMRRADDLMYASKIPGPRGPRPR
jgi:diguanylate cyclase (GGDEF)-like protein